MRKAIEMADERKDQPGWWSDAPLGGREQNMSLASRTAMGGDPPGISGRGAAEADEEGLGAATQDVSGAEDERGNRAGAQAQGYGDPSGVQGQGYGGVGTQGDQTDVTGVNPPDVESGQRDNLGTTGYGGPLGQTGEMAPGVQADQSEQGVSSNQDSPSSASNQGVHGAVSHAEEH